MNLCIKCRENFSYEFRIPKILNCKHVTCILCIYKELLLKDIFKCHCNTEIYNIRELEDLPIAYNLETNSNKRNKFNLFSSNKKNWSQTKFRDYSNSPIVYKSTKNSIKRLGMSYESCKMNGCKKILYGKSKFCSEECEIRFFSLSKIKNGINKKNISEFNISQIKSSNNRQNNYLKRRFCVYPGCNNFRNIKNWIELPFCDKICNEKWLDWPENKPINL